jgi:TM2 domain-containing membrane protein YozV
MKGQILNFSVQNNEGIITTAEGARFSFLGADWKSDAIPTRGAWVDFEVLDQRAIGVYRALGNAITSKQEGKNKSITTLLAIFLGGFGAHKFYLGSWGWGIVYLLTCWLYVPFVVAMVEWIRIVLMSDEEFYSKLSEFQVLDPHPFRFFW